MACRHSLSAFCRQPATREREGRGVILSLASSIFSETIWASCRFNQSDLGEGLHVEEPAGRLKMTFGHRAFRVSDWKTKPARLYQGVSDLGRHPGRDRVVGHRAYGVWLRCARTYYRGDAGGIDFNEDDPPVYLGLRLPGLHHWDELPGVRPRSDGSPSGMHCSPTFRSSWWGSRSTWWPAYSSE